MLDDTTPADDQATTPDTGSETAADTGPDSAGPPTKAAKRAPAKKAAAKKATAKKTPAKKAAAKKTAAAAAPAADTDQAAAPAAEPAVETDAAAAAAKKTTKKAAAKKAPAKRAAAKKTAAKKTAAESPEPAPEPDADAATTGEAPAPTTGRKRAPAVAVPLFQPPEPTKAAPRRKKAAAAPAETSEAAGQETPDESPKESARESARETAQDAPATPRRRTRGGGTAKKSADAAAGDAADELVPAAGQAGQSDDDEDEHSTGPRRRRRRGGRRRRKSGEGGDNGASQDDNDTSDASDASSGGRDDQAGRDDNGNGESSSSRRRRRRRRSGDDGDGGSDDPENTVTRVRKPRSAEDEITALHGSTRLEAKKQRRREGREAGRRRAPIVSEAEFLARREAVDRVMVIRQRKDLTQIAVLEDKVLVEHYVARESQTSLIGNVYLGRVQNVLPSMEAAFIDIGKGRNAVLYAGEVNWDALGAGNGPRKIEQVLKSGQAVLVQVTKDPIGHKGARLTSQVSLPGRFLVYVPDGTTSGISRKLPDTERTRLKNLLKEIVPDSAGVIVRTAAEGASEDELTRDVERLTARWTDIESKVEKGNAPQLLYGEPDLTLKVVRDLFTEDFAKLVVSGEDAWDMVENYVGHVAPDLADRLERYDGTDVFADYRIDEQIAKALDRKVWLPSGGSLVIDRTEAMTVVDVNTGKFTGSGGNLEETVTKNNLEAAEEIVRQLRLRDIGGIIVVDFIDMVLESNRDLVLRRMVECLGRDRTRHQVAEVTSLGLVQMTRKRIGTGLVEAFSESCEHCQGRGLILHHEPVEHRHKADDEPRRGGSRSRSGRGRGRDDDAGNDNGNGNGSSTPSPKDVAAMAKPAPAETRGETGSTESATADSSRGDTDPTNAPANDAASDDSAPPARRSRSRSRSTGADAAAEKPAGSTRSARQPKSAPATEPSTSEQPTGTAATAATGAPAEADGRAPDEPQQPAGRTRARRSSSRREAGPPAGAESAPAAVVVTEPAPAPDSAGATDVADTSGEPMTETPPAPRVVTSRRRVARRPAGPPVGGPEDASPNDAGPGETAPEGADAESGDAAAVPVHVPVKKKGARKR